MTMSTRRANPRRVKIHRSYDTHELALCLGVHKNTIRHWKANGLEPVDGCRPLLFQGAVVRIFLSTRNANRRRPCQPGTLFCFRCREPRPPALGMVEYVPLRPTSGNLQAICGACEGIMHRCVRTADIDRVMPGIEVQIAEGRPRLSGQTAPSLNCNYERQG